MSERTLILLRHAKSDWSGDEADIARPLAKRGRRQAPDAGRWLAANIDSIDLAVVSPSPASRARSTWDLVSAGLNVPPRTRIDDRVYGIEDLVSHLIGEWEPMPTSALAVITVSGSWSTAGHHSELPRASGRPPAK